MRDAWIIINNQYAGMGTKSCSYFHYATNIEIKSKDFVYFSLIVLF